jgi:hypothetical protein
MKYAVHRLYAEPFLSDLAVKMQSDYHHGQQDR